MDRRWRANGIEYKPYGKRNTRPLWNAIQKHGWDSFEHVILEDRLTDEEACEKEKYYIKYYHSSDRSKGYNIAIGGNGGVIYKTHPRGMAGKKHTNEWKANHSSWASDHSHNCMNNGQVVWGKTHEHPKGFLNHAHTEDERRRISQTLRANKNRKSLKKTRVRYPDGRELRFESVTEMLEVLGITQMIYTRIKRCGMVYRVSPMSGNPHPELDGCMFFVDR